MNNNHENISMVPISHVQKTFMESIIDYNTGSMSEYEDTIEIPEWHLSFIADLINQHIVSAARNGELMIDCDIVPSRGDVRTGITVSGTSGRGGGPRGNAQIIVSMRTRTMPDDGNEICFATERELVQYCMVLKYEITELYEGYGFEVTSENDTHPGRRGGGGRFNASMVQDNAFRFCISWDQNHVLSEHYDKIISDAQLELVESGVPVQDVLA